MATKTTLLLAAAAAAAGLAVLSKKKKKTTTTTTNGDTPMVDLPVTNRPLCGKHPSGKWSDYHGHLKGEPPGNPGWTKDDLAAVMSAINRRVPSPLPTFENMKEARKISFDITRQVAIDLCPQMKIPDKQVTVENHMKQSPGFEHLWQQVETKVWNRLVGDPGGGN